MGNIQTSSTSGSGAENSQNFALVLSYDRFVKSYQRPREGNDKDVQNIKNLLSSPNFEYQEYRNLTADETKQRIKNLSTQEDYANYSSLVIIVLTHGWYGGTLCANDTYFKTTDVWGPLIDSPNFKNKPKLILFQACRGSSVEKVMKVGCMPTANYGAKLDNNIIFDIPKLPHDPTFLIAYSTVENTVSVRNEMTGSWYIETLCRELKYNDSDVNLTTLLTRVTNTLVSRSLGSHAQTPTFISFLPYNIIVNPPTDNFTDMIKGLDINEYFLPPNSALNQTDLIGASAQPRICDNKLTFDGKGNLSNIKTLHTFYPWNHAGNGRALIFHTAIYERGAQLLMETLEEVNVGTELHLIEGDNFISILQAVSQQPNLTEVNCLMIVVLGPITSYDTGSQESHVAGQLISSTWSPFIASTCPNLHTKPKIFLYLDKLDTTDECIQGDEKCDQLSYAADQVTDHVDFLHVIGYGRAYFEALLHNLKTGITSRADIYDILTMTKSQTLQEMNAQNITIKLLPHYKSTLSLLLKFEPTLEESQEKSALVPLYNENLIVEYKAMQAELQNLQTQLEESKPSTAISLQIDEDKVKDELSTLGKDIARASDCIGDCIKDITDKSVDIAKDVAPKIAKKAEKAAESIAAHIAEPKKIIRGIRSWF